MTGANNQASAGEFLSTMFKLPKMMSIPLKKKKTLKEESGPDTARGIIQKLEIISTNVISTPITNKKTLLKFDTEKII